MASALDKKDNAILNLMQDDGRRTVSDVAERVGLSVAAAGERIKKLLDEGYIRRVQAMVDPKKLGLDVTAFILVIMTSSAHYPDLVRRAKGAAEIEECHSVTGEGSHILKVRTENTSALERFLSKLQGWPGVVRTQTMIVMSTYKEDPTIQIR